MRGKQWMVFLVALMLAMYAGTGQAAVLYANQVVSSSDVIDAGNLLGAHNGTLATFSDGGQAVLSFGGTFSDGGFILEFPDVMVDIATADFFYNDLSVYAREVGTASWTQLGFTAIGDPRFGEIPGYYLLSSNEYDLVRLSFNDSRFNSYFQVDAVSVLYGNDAPAPVPEPGTMMLLGSGLVGLAGWGRKKLRK